MKLLIQRVKKAYVSVNNQVVGSIDMGLVVFVGITHSDTVKEASWLAQKLVNLRLFENQEGKLHFSLIENKGSVLIISQFTLYGDCQEGRRPSFTLAAKPEIAKKLYESFLDEVKSLGVFTQQGIFGAKMEVFLVNDGPLTLVLEKESIDE